MEKYKMNTKLTERERELLYYIQQLLNIISIQSVYLQYMEKMRIWLHDNMKQIDTETIELDLIEYLDSEFGLKYKKITEKDIFKSSDNLQN